MSGKTALFPRNDRPYGLKRAAFQTENALRGFLYSFIRMRIFSALPGGRRAEGKRRGTERVTVLIKCAGEGEGAGRPKAEKRKCSLVTPMARGSPWLTGPQRALFIYTGVRNVSRPRKGRAEEKEKRPCVPVEKNKNPALGKRESQSFPGGNP